LLLLVEEEATQTLTTLPTDFGIIVAGWFGYYRL